MNMMYGYFHIISVIINITDKLINGTYHSRHVRFHFLVHAFSRHLHLDRSPYQLSNQVVDVATDAAAAAAEPLRAVNQSLRVTPPCTPDVWNVVAENLLHSPHDDDLVYHPLDDPGHEANYSSTRRVIPRPFLNGN